MQGSCRDDCLSIPTTNQPTQSLTDGRTHGHHAGRGTGGLLRSPAANIQMDDRSDGESYGALPTAWDPESFVYSLS